MKILIIGFQRSGTTLTRRIVQGHPEVKRIFHEQFLLNKFPNIKNLLSYVRSLDIDPKQDNWGEKVPFYPSAKGYPITKYCEAWNEYFGKQSRILHIVRHPLDVSFSVVNKYKANFDHPLALYQRRMVKYIPKIMEMDNTFTFKYEDLLLNPEKLIPRIFWFCGVDKNADFRSYLSTITDSKRYRKINKSRAFAYKKKTFKTDIDLTDVIKVCNRIDGPEYKI